MDFSTYTKAYDSVFIFIDIPSKLLRIPSSQGRTSTTKRMCNKCGTENVEMLQLRKKPDKTPSYPIADSYLVQEVNEKMPNHKKA